MMTAEVQLAKDKAMAQTKNLKPDFKWEDPLDLEDLLGEEERMIRDTAHQFAQERLMPRVLEANRHETFDPEIMKEMGALDRKSVV